MFNEYALKIYEQTYILTTYSAHMKFKRLMSWAQRAAATRLTIIYNGMHTTKGAMHGRNGYTQG